MTTSSAKGITKNYDEKKLDLRAYRGKWNNKHEYDVVRKTRERFNELAIHKATSCYWDNHPTYKEANRLAIMGDDSKPGSDWHAHFNMCYKKWSMWRQMKDSEPNLKSSMSFSTVESALAEYVGNNIGVTLTPGNKGDSPEQVKLFQYAIEDAESKGDLKQLKADSFQEDMILGTSIDHNCYTHIEQEFEMILRGEELDKDLEDLKSRGKEEYSKKMEEIKGIQTEGKPLTKKQKKVLFSGLDMVRVSPYEFFPDDAARSLHGRSNGANDCAWRTTPSVEHARIYFETHYDPWIIKANINKIKACSQAADEYASEDAFFFAQSEDLKSKPNSVEMIRYYNVATDRYIIIVNDIVLRDGPLPYNHKRLPFSRHTFINFPHMFWGIGFPTVLESLQSEDEVIINAILRELEIAQDPPLLVNTDVIEDISSQYERAEAGLIIEVGGPISDANVRYLPMPQYRFEAKQMSQDLWSRGNVTTGINSLMYSTPTPGQPVRNNIMSMESTYKILRKGIANWGHGYVETCRQWVEIIMQVFPDQFTEEEEEIEEDGKKITRKKKVYKEIEINGYQIQPDTEGVLEEFGIKGSSFFELTPEYLRLKGSPNIKYEIDQFVPQTQAVKIERLDKALAMFMKVLPNPQLMEAPGMAELLRDYIDANGLNPRIKDKIKDSGNEDDIILAMEQNIEMLEEGKAVPGRAGRSDTHKIIHFQAIMNLAVLLLNPPKGLTPEAMKVHADKLQLMVEHLNVDNTPRGAGEQAATDMAKMARDAVNPRPPEAMAPPQQGAPVGPEGMAMPVEAMAQAMQGMGGAGGIPSAGAPEAGGGY